MRHFGDYVQEAAIRWLEHAPEMRSPRNARQKDDENEAN